MLQVVFWLIVILVPKAQFLSLREKRCKFDRQYNQNLPTVITIVTVNYLLANVSSFECFANLLRIFKNGIMKLSHFSFVYFGPIRKRRMSKPNFSSWRLLHSKRVSKPQWNPGRLLCRGVLVISKLFVYHHLINVFLSALAFAACLYKLHAADQSLKPTEVTFQIPAFLSPILPIKPAPIRLPSRNLV